jgi:predicted tellurium resistance membrane protein TerC
VVLMGIAASFIAKLLERHRWIAWVGLVIVLYIALKLIWEGGHDVWQRWPWLQSLFG